MTYKRISPAPVSEGGTNASSMANTYGVNYYDGTRIVTTTVGTATHVLTSNGVGVAPTFQAVPASSVAIAGDSGSSSGNSFTFTSSNSAGGTTSLVSGTGTITLNVTDVNNNTCIGASSGNATIVGSGNCGFGESSLQNVTSGSGSIAIGNNSLKVLSTGDANIAIGDVSANLLDTGDYNVIIGALSGASYTTDESSNILIGYNVSGTAAEDNTCRIGTATGTGSGELAKTFIQGIAGVTVANTAAVLIDTTTGQLGTVVSSERYKENIRPMDEYSECIYDLNPVLFNLKRDITKKTQPGLIAEQVEAICPELVAYNREGLPESVKYHDIPVLLLNEIKKLSHRINQIEEELNGRTK